MISEAKASHKDPDPQDPSDLLDYLLKAQAKDPARMTDPDMTSALLNNLYVLHITWNNVH